jgi:hypothetical protein
MNGRDCLNRSNTESGHKRQALGSDPSGVKISAKTFPCLSVLTKLRPCYTIYDPNNVIA